MPALCGLPQERDTFHQVSFGPEAQDLEVDLLAGGNVPKREVRDKRGFWWEREYARPRFKLPVACILCSAPCPGEGFAHVILADIRRAFVVADKLGGLGVEFQDSFAALPGDVGVELPGGGEEEAGEKLGKPQSVLTGTAEERERTV